MQTIAESFAVFWTWHGSDQWDNENMARRRHNTRTVFKKNNVKYLVDTSVSTETNTFLFWAVWSALIPAIHLRRDYSRVEGELFSDGTATLRPSVAHYLDTTNPTTDAALQNCQGCQFWPAKWLWLSKSSQNWMVKIRYIVFPKFWKNKVPS